MTSPFCVPVPSQFLNQLTDFNEIWYERYANGGHPNRVIFISYNL
jgi:hypothetical protein